MSRPIVSTVPSSFSTEWDVATSRLRMYMYHSVPSSQPSVYRDCMDYKTYNSVGDRFSWDVEPDWRIPLSCVAVSNGPTDRTG